MKIEKIKEELHTIINHHADDRLLRMMSAIAEVYNETDDKKKAKKKSKK